MKTFYNYNLVSDKCLSLKTDYIYLNINSKFFFSPKDSLKRVEFVEIIIFELKTPRYELYLFV